MYALSFVLFPERACKKLLTMVSVKEDGNAEGSFFCFLFFWLCWVFVAACRLSLVVASRGYSSLRCVAYCRGFSCCGARALGAWASVVVARGLSSCGTRA